MSRPAEFRAVRNDVRGFFVTLGCSCGEEFERYQPSLAGLAFGEHACPSCGEVQDVAPEPFLAALALEFDDTGVERASVVAEAASGIAEGWHRVPALAALLEHRGVALGPPTERELLALLVRGLYALERERRR